MSAHVATVSMGRTGSASGKLKSAHAVGHLYVGGAGTWHFHRLAGKDAGRSLTLPSAGFDELWSEVAAAFAVLLHPEPGLASVAAGLRALKMRSDIEHLDSAQVRDVARLAADLDVAAAVTVFGGAVPEVLGDLSAVPGWSVQVAGPVFERLHSRWGTADTREKLGD